MRHVVNGLIIFILNEGVVERGFLYNVYVLDSNVLGHRVSIDVDQFSEADGVVLTNIELPRLFFVLMSGAPSAIPSMDPLYVGNIKADTDLTANVFQEVHPHLVCTS